GAARAPPTTFTAGVVRHRRQRPSSCPRTHEIPAAASRVLGLKARRGHQTS
ncbi:hypothetical protein LEMLEM_LOCUS11781, partial [Lemmus lemmus]